MKLVYDHNQAPVSVGDMVCLSNGEDVFVVQYITEPHKPSSTGRVGVKHILDDGTLSLSTEYFPSVIGAHWIDREDQAAADLYI